MAKPRLPKAVAKAKGSDVAQRKTHASRTEPVVTQGIGDPHVWLNDNAKLAWIEIVSEIPWLNASHRGHLAIAASIRGRMMAGDECGVQALNLLRQCYGQMGATPADASKAGAKPDGESEDPADEFFR